MSESPPPPATIAEVLDLAARDLEVAGLPDARREAEVLFARIAGRDRGWVAASKRDAIDPATAERFGHAVARRARRCPLQYVTGVQEFRGLPMAVDPRVLIPRPETELVVDAAMSLIPAAGAIAADLGTGSGCIAIALVVERPGLHVLALDSSAPALDLARQNALRFGVLDRIVFALGDLADPPAAWHGTVDLVISNPPYVAAAEWDDLAPEVRDWEPKTALVPGPTGDEAYRPLARAARALLRDGGWLVAEIGHTNAAGARAALADAGFTAVEVRPDLRGIDRIVLGRKG